MMYLLLGLTAVAIWCKLLFVGNPAGISSASIFRFVVLDGSGLISYRWFFLLPFACFALSAGYFSKFSMSRNGSGLLFGIGIVLAILGWVETPFEFGLGASLPLFFAWRTWLQRPVSSETKHNTDHPEE